MRDAGHLTHLSVVMEVGDVTESCPGNLNVETKIGLNALRPLMCLVSMRPGDQLNCTSSLSQHKQLSAT